MKTRGCIRSPFVCSEDFYFGKIMMRASHILFFILFSVIPAGCLFAEGEIFAIQGEQKLEQGELDAAFQQIPQSDRLTFIRNGELVDRLVQNILRTRQIAADARNAGFDQQENVANRMKLEAERELAKAWIEHVVANAPEADFEAMAYEYYLGHPEEFVSVETLDVSHILVSTETRSDEEALAIVDQIATRLKENPAGFDDLVTQYSDDPAKENNGGRYSQMKRGDMVKPFEEAAFSLTQDGELSDAVKTNYGYHLIRLNARNPEAPLEFEAVKARLVKQERERYLDDYRTRYIRKLTQDPIELPDGAVEAMLKRYFGENLELAPR